MAYVWDIPATPRYHVYFSIFLWACVLPGYAFMWFIAGYLFYFDEYKYESLDYDEFIDDYVDMFQVNVSEDVEKVFKNSEAIREYYEAKGAPSDFVIRDASSASSDFDHERVAQEWDSGEMASLLWMLDFLNEEWEYEAEVDVDDECDFKFEDLEQFYMFLHTNRERESNKRRNTFEMRTRTHISNSGVSTLPLHHLQRTMANLPADVRLFLYSKDDFRFHYWRLLARKQIIVEPPKQPKFSKPIKKTLYK